MSTFLELQNAVILGLLDESDRAASKTYINHRYGWILALEEWSFLNDTANVIVTAGSQSVSGLPTDFGIPIGLWDSDGNALQAMSDWRAFMGRYNANLGDSGTPEAYTVIGSSLLVGPLPDTTASDYLLAYELEGAAMVADGDVPIIPVLFHVALIHGGRAEAMKMNHNPAWTSVEQDFLASIDAMRRRYLVSVRSTGEQVPAYRP